MAKYSCGICGSFLVNRPINKNRKEDGKQPLKETISYKVLIVRTERHYVCPNGHELTEVKKYGGKFKT